MSRAMRGNFVIASKAKQSISAADGSLRRYAPRDDGLGAAVQMVIFHPA
jgi:hypothetical protein